MEQARQLTYDIIEDLPNLSIDTSYTDGIIKGLKYIGFFIIDLDSNEGIKYYCGEMKSILSDIDLVEVKKFTPSKYKLYIEDYYRIDFENYIYLFRHIEKEDKKLMMGNLLQKDLKTRLNLAEIYQQCIMRKLIYA